MSVKIVKYSVLTILNTHLLTVRKIFTLCFIKNLFLFKNMKLQQEKNEFQYIFKKYIELKCDNFTDDNEGIILYGNVFINCEIIDDRESS